MNFLLLVCVLWSSMNFDTSDGAQIVHDFGDCYEGEYRATVVTCYDGPCKLKSAEAHHDKYGRVTIWGRLGQRPFKNPVCHRACFCRGDDEIESKQVCTRRMGANPIRGPKINFVVRCKKDTRNLKLKVDVNGIFGNHKVPITPPPTTKQPTTTTTTTTTTKKDSTTSTTTTTTTTTKPKPTCSLTSTPAVKPTTTTAKPKPTCSLTSTPAVKPATTTTKPKPTCSLTSTPAGPHENATGVHEEFIGAMLAGSELHFLAGCKGHCFFYKILTKFRFGGDVDLFGLSHHAFRGGEKCHSDRCFCAGTSSHPSQDTCINIAVERGNRAYITVRSSLASSDVWLRLESDNLMFLKKYVPSGGHNVKALRIGDLAEGESRYYLATCSDDCSVDTLYTLFAFGGDVDVYGSAHSVFKKKGIKCYFYDCFCAGSSSHPTIDHCTKQTKISSRKFYVTVRGYLASKRVVLYYKGNIDSIVPYNPH